jgi:hypothetical protein
MTAGLVIALAECCRAFFFGFLRGDVAVPLFAYSLGALLGARSLRPLRSYHLLPIVGAGLLFVHFYGLLGEVRGRYEGGWAKIADMRQYQAHRFDDPAAPPQQTVLARLTSFNQLSQIGALVERNGFYDGRTLEYLSFAFVPRFLWPDKPPIAPGAWYAMEIGEGTATPDGWFSTSINMTVAGELFLNFGWRGVVLGLLLFGAVVGLFWTSTAFWTTGSTNVIGGAFALTIFWTMLGGSSELTVLVTLLALYLIFLAMSLAVALHAFVHELIRTAALRRNDRTFAWFPVRSAFALTHLRRGGVGRAVFFATSVTRSR